MNFKIMVLIFALFTSNALFCPVQNYQPQKTTPQEAPAPSQDWLSQPMNQNTLYIIAACAGALLITSYIVSKFGDDSKPADDPF